MLRNLKVLGLALGAVLALSALTAAGASAAAFQSPAEGHAKGSQTTTHTFTAGSGVGSVTCSTATFAVVSTAAVQSEPQVEPTYSDCHTVVLGTTYKADISMNGCKYKFHINSGSADSWAGTADIVGCNAGKKIVVNVTKSGSEESKCLIEIAEQTGLNGISYTNNTSASPEDLVVTTTTNNVTDTTSGGLLGCGIGNGTHTNGTYEGSTTMQSETLGGTPQALTVM